VTVTEQTKRCSKCGETKPLSGFYKNRKPSHGRPGLKSACKSCETVVRAASREPTAKPPLPTFEEMQRWYRDGCRVA
jgi:hypothetical protein